jgi:hypothetical protein
VGSGGVSVGDSMLMLFSGQAQVSANTAFISFASGGSQTFQLTVSDANGNPLSRGTTISAVLQATSDSAAVVSYRGIPDQPYDDYLTRGPGRTDYSVTVYDATPGGASTFVIFTLEITVSGLNGSAFLSIPGRIN